LRALRESAERARGSAPARPTVVSRALRARGCILPPKSPALHPPASAVAFAGSSRWTASQEIRVAGTSA
jgi:hypothetical protein